MFTVFNTLTFYTLIYYSNDMLIFLFRFQYLSVVNVIGVFPVGTYVPGNVYVSTRMCKKKNVIWIIHMNQILNIQKNDPLDYVVVI